MRELPIVCTLTPESLASRRRDLLPGLIARASATTFVDEGMRLQFLPSSETLQAILSTVDAERQCCRFLRFELSVEADGGPMSLSVTGPAGTRSFLEGLADLSR